MKTEFANDSSPQITTIIPTYRRPKFLKYAIQSVLDQTYKDLIVLVCDNASGDETKSVVMSLAEKDPRVKYFCQQEHVSLEDNFETGLRLVTTPFYSFLCDDDFFLPWFYETALTSLNQNPQAMMFAGGTLIVDHKQSLYQVNKPPYEGLWNINSCQPEDLANVTSQFIFTANVFRKGEHEKLGRKDRKAGWDIMMTTNVLTNYSIQISSKLVVGYRIHPQSASIQGRGKHGSCLNSEILEQSYLGDNPQLKTKFKHADNLSNKWKEFIIATLQNNVYGATFFYKIVKNEFKLKAFFLYFFGLVCKIPPIRKVLAILYSLYSKNKRKKKNKAANSEYIDLIYKYTFPIPD